MSADLEKELQALMVSALQGDTAAYELFLKKVSESLRSLLTHLMRPRGLSPDRVEDLLQDSLFAIHRKRDLYRADQPILPWIRAIARHRFIDQWRSEARRPSFVEWDEAFERFAVTEPLPLESEQRDHAQSADYLLAGLTDRQRQIVTLAKVDEIPLATIASKFGMTLSAVKVSVHRSLKKMRDQSGGQR